MKYAEAIKIFKAWQNYAEIDDKLSNVFQKIPESFLPYPKNEIETALEIVARDQNSAGNKAFVDAIGFSQIKLFTHYVNDEQAIEAILTGLLAHPESRKTLLEQLAKTRDSWLRQSRSLYSEE